MPVIDSASVAPADPFNIDAPGEGAIALTLDTVARPGRLLAINASAAGNVSVTFSDGSTYTFPVAAGLTLVPFSVTKVNTSGTTATATYANIK